MGSVLNVFLILLLGISFPPASLTGGNPQGGRFDEKTLKSHESAVLWADLHDRMRLVPTTAADSTDLLRVSYPKGGWGTKNSGAQIMFKLPPVETATCQYRVRFADDFDFVKGGKLPGLAGGTATSGNRRPNGDGWTARLMWRKHGDAVLYLYHLDQHKVHGDDFPLGVRFKPGKWHHVRERVTVNHDGQSDGRIEIWIDGKLALDKGSLRLRRGNQATVDRFYFSTFFGGQGNDWAPAKDQSIDFANIETKSSR